MINLSHITIEEINSLTEDEKGMLLFICNSWAPIPPFTPTPEDPFPASLNIIRYTRKEAILDRIIQAEKVISEIAKSVYEGLREKLKIPVVKKVEEPVVSGSITQSTGSI